MPRCPDCSKFVSLETTAEMNGEVSVAEDGQITADIRLIRNCADCSTELKDTNLDLEGKVETEEPCKDGTEHSWELDEEGEPEPYDRAQTTDKNGKPIKSSRYIKTFIGVELTVGVKCTVCGTEVEVTLKDEVPAGSFDELN